MSRRFFVNKLVSLPVIAAAIPTAVPAVLANPPRAEAASADSELLALADEYIRAVQVYGDALVARDELGEKASSGQPTKRTR
jgi:hypothetical protein